jgi:flagellar hook-associated protein 1 FlgK
MAISSFYGLQTSLRGLLAQQRLLDTTGHNIANASTQGYSRQEAVLAASPALMVPAGATSTGAGAMLGSGVDVENYRRVRDQFLDVQYRGQATNLADWSARAGALGNAETALAEPSDNGINAQLQKFWGAWSDLANSASDSSAGIAARQTLVSQGQSLADAVRTVYAQIQTVQQQSYAQYQDISRPAGPGDAGGQVAQIAKQIADLNKTISQFKTAGDDPNDLEDRRDQLLDQLSGLGQISVTTLPTGSMNVAFVNGGGPPVDVVNDLNSVWAGPPAQDNWTPGGQLGGLLAVSQPGGTLDGYLGELDTFATNLAGLVNGAYGGTFLQVGAPPAGGSAPQGAAAGLAVNPSLVTDPRTVVAGSGNSGSNDIAMAVSQLRGNPAIDGAYGSFIAQFGAEVDEANRQQTNAQALTDSVDNRRQSVSGVSMDEEMTNLVKFQRAYQASSRAMSTMDEMLDVLINRTGKVGL